MLKHCFEENYSSRKPVVCSLVPKCPSLTFLPVFDEFAEC